MTTSEPPSAYLRALEAAHALGRADGRLAAEVEPDGEPAAVGAWCHGLCPDDLARLVWHAGAGAAPAGVRLNAPHWYADGFREALAGARAHRGCRAGSGTPGTEHGRPPARAASSALVHHAPPDRARDRPGRRPQENRRAP